MQKKTKIECISVISMQKFGLNMVFSLSTTIFLKFGLFYTKKKVDYLKYYLKTLLLLCNIMYNYTRYDQNITVILNFFKKYFFFINNYLVSFKIIPVLMPAFLFCFQSSKHFWSAIFGIANSFCYDFSLICLIVAKQDVWSLVSMS